MVSDDMGEASEERRRGFVGSCGYRVLFPRVRQKTVVVGVVGEINGGASGAAARRTVQHVLKVCVQFSTLTSAAASVFTSASPSLASLSSASPVTASTTLPPVTSQANWNGVHANFAPATAPSATSPRTAANPPPILPRRPPSSPRLIAVKTA